MKTLYKYEKSSVDTAVALGTFDGVHLAHLKIIENMQKNAGSLKTCVCTFSNAPRAYFDSEFKVLLTPEEKQNVLAKTGVDMAVLKEFDSEVAHTHPEEFLRYLFEDLRAKVVVCGFNYRFGAGAKGNSELLLSYANRYGVRVIVQEEIRLQGKRISSTRIRTAVKDANVALARELMGRPYVVSGEVVTGKRIGRTINFPTVNINTPKGKIIAKTGVYAVYLQLGSDLYPAMCNIGARPTIEEGSEINIETHIFDFDANIYGMFVRIHFIARVRDEIKFSGLSGLTAQLEMDKIHVKKALQKAGDVVDLTL